MKKYIILSAFLIISISTMAQKADSVKKEKAAEKNDSPTDSLLNSMNSDDKKEPVVIFRSLPGKSYRNLPKR